MSGTKAALKAAKAAIDNSQWDEAIKNANTVLETDKSNYFAKLFLGRAYEKTDEIDKAAKVYHEAAELKPDDTQAWQGLISLYEPRGSKYLDAYGEVAVKLAVLFAQAGDLHRAQSTIDKLITLAKKNGTPAQHKRALQVLLPGSPVWTFLEGRLQHPSLTFRRLIDITEKDEQARITKEIAERRTRIGARLGKVTEEVKREVYATSDLEALYRSAIDWTDDDTTRRELEEKLFQRAYDTLIVLPSELKDTKRSQVIETARGMVLVKHTLRLAWDVHLEWSDTARIEDLDVNVLLEYVAFFPDAGLSRVLRAFLRSEASPFTLPPRDEAEESDDTSQLSAEDRLILMVEGLGDGKASQLAHRLTAEYYSTLEEYESVIDTVRTGLRLLKIEEFKAGISLQMSKDAFNTILASALVHFQSPRNHPEARGLMEDILQRDPDSAQALAGLGLVHEEEGNYQEAIKFLSRALSQDPGSLKLRIEAAWCRALAGSLEEASAELKSCLEDITTKDPKSNDLRALVQYRIGKCQWDLDPSKAARKDRKGAYALFLAAIKANPNFAPAYTSLGFYYADYAKDKKRARQCFQKAFELSASEVEAAEHLASAFADQGEWDVVELVAHRVIESGKTKPSAGSRRKGISWPFSALGVVQMTRQEYSQAITSFLSALRISPDDYHSYVGLGESYHNSGRYNSASRTFHYAEAPHDGVEMKISGEKWFTEYMLANVHRELGDHDQAIDLLCAVLEKRPDEFGVLIALLQTYVERAWRLLDSGFFGRATESASGALTVAREVARTRPEAFNLWKAVGDACSIYQWAQSAAHDFPHEDTRILIQDGVSADVFDVLSDLDNTNAGSFQSAAHTNGNDGNRPSEYLSFALLAYKRAIHCCSNDLHAQAVAWYNLGWAEYRAYTGTTSKHARGFSMAAVRCFKRAIELEAGNSEFWNALGVATSKLNVKVSQHAFVRSLYLNERSADTWTNLGVLSLINNDHELAHQAFGRAQSTDPDCGHAWLGEGLIALNIGDTKEALSHFVHAFEISHSSSVVTKKQYTVSVFDSLVSKAAVSSELTQLIQPLFALHQIYAQVPTDSVSRHLSALLAERVGDHDSATSTLTSLCSILEAEYETTESPATLIRFAHAKSDLARNLLAQHSYEEAIDQASTSIDLTTDTDGPDASLARIRLSAHLVQGLAHFYLSNLDKSIDAFRSALTESSSDPAVICQLSQVLWATAGDAQRQVARDQLAACVASHPGYVEAWVLLAAMAGLDKDEDTAAAVRADLLALRADDAVGVVEAGMIDRALVALAGAMGDPSDELRAAIVRAPDGVGAWKELARHVGGEDGEYAARMALLAATRAVPPYGSLGAEELAAVYGGTGDAGHVQKAVMLAPWEAYKTTA